jgi:hypothetical protein
VRTILARTPQALRGLDSRVTCRYLRERIQFRSSLESVKWAVLPAHFFWLIDSCPPFQRPRPLQLP